MATSGPPPEEASRHVKPRGSFVTLDNAGDFESVLTWLRNSANRAVNQRSYSDVNFRFVADVGSTFPLLNFWNWSLTFQTQDVEQVEQVEQTIDQETGEPVVDSNGDEVYDELWEQMTVITLNFYNRHGWWDDPSDHHDTHYKNKDVVLTYEYSEMSIISPSDIELGVTEDDAAAELYSPNFGPDIYFEQEMDDVYAMQELHKPKFVAIFTEPSDVAGEFTKVTRPVIVSEHVRAAVEAGIERGLPPPIAEAIGEAMKRDAHYFTPDSVTAGLQAEVRLVAMHAWTNDVLLRRWRLRPRVDTVYSWNYPRSPTKTTRRSDGSPPQRRGERRPEKRPRTGANFVSCDSCKRHQAKFSCGGCSKAVYCSPECQELAWTGNHEHACQ